MSGTWRAVRRGWRVWLPVVVINAAIQALLVVGDPEPAASATFALLVIASFVVAALALAIVEANAGGSPRWPGPALLLWSTLSVLFVVGMSVISPLLAPVAVLVGVLALAPIAAGERNPLAGFTVFAHSPVRSVFACLAALTLVLVCWLVSLLLGFFVTGPVAAAVTWLWFGATGVVLACWFGVGWQRWSSNEK